MLFLGHLVSQCGIQANLAKGSIVRQHPVPNSVTELKSFLGLCSDYRRYVLRLRSNCSTSSSGNRGNKRNQLELGRPTGLWTTEKLPHFVTQFSLSLNEKAIRPVHWRKSVFNRRCSCQSTKWPRASHLLCFEIPQQNLKLLLDNKLRTFGYSHLHRTVQALLSWPTIQEHYGPQSVSKALFF